jgi:polyisoprenoid-binding protein YceI
MKTLSIAPLALLLAAQDEATTYYVGHHAKFVNISFSSDADLETIVGSTNSATGEIVLNLAKKTASVSLSVPVESLKTGIDLRDEHLRSKYWLDAEAHPEITFKSLKVDFLKEKENEVEVQGEFTMRGVTKPLKTTVQWRELPEGAAKKAGFPEGRWIRFTTSFDVKLSDFGVKIPDVAVGKVSDTWKVAMTLFAGTAKPKK